MPQVLEPGETKLFNTFVALPICWVTYDEEESVYLGYVPDLKERMTKFDQCTSSDEQTAECFKNLTGKYLPNYLYETIEYPAGFGEQRINGIGVSVSDFDYVAETEVNMYDNFLPFSANEDIPLFSFENFAHRHYIDNLSLPWWRKIYYLDYGDGSAQGSNFVLATGDYGIILISLYGWFFILRMVVNPTNFKKLRELLNTRKS